MNVAVTAASAFMVTLHAPVPLQLPDHPANVDPEFGAALSVTAAPFVKFALHVDPQLMPAGLLVTVPAPAPALLTVNWKLDGGGGLEFTWLELQPDKTNVTSPKHRKH